MGLSHQRRWTAKWQRYLLVLCISVGLPLSAQAAEHVLFLTPAPSTLPVFAVLQLAKFRGYFSQEGLNVDFKSARGGAEVAKQVAAGNADLGGGVGETSMIVRPNGVHVKGVVLLGGGSLFRIAIRPGLGIHSVGQLRGHSIGVSSFADTSYYSLKGVLAANGLSTEDVNIEALPSAQLPAQMLQGNVDAIVCTPDWEQVMEEHGLKPIYISIQKYFPAMAQAVLASDQTIKERPQLVGGAVRALIRAMEDIIRDPSAAARSFIAAVPQYKGQEKRLSQLLHKYAVQVFATYPETDLGRFNKERMVKVEKFYFDTGIIKKMTSVPQLYTNEFVPIQSIKR
jgi:NitT/TauT family transport system substrate-binding protein